MTTIQALNPEARLHKQFWIGGGKLMERPGIDEAGVR
jgi:hypothetical protein